MPFERYLQPDEPAFFPTRDPAGPLSSPWSSSAQHVQFRIPQYLLDGPSVLAHGGGAEVLNPSVFASQGAAVWLANNGFVTKQLHPRSFSLPEPYPCGHAFLQSSDPDDYNSDRKLSDSSAVSDLSSSSGSSLSSSSPISLISPSASAVFNYQFPVQSHTCVAPGLRSVGVAPQLGLPVYSASGFDILSILSRVVNRPHPSVVLGPVDMTCSFVVVDVRRHDSPIVYASPTFSSLSGYDEHEIIGKNCRFLQAPKGLVQRGEKRRFTSNDAVSQLRKSLSADKECQVSMVNYRKNGDPFINLVTVIPLYGGVDNTPEDAEQVAFHVGFQVDLTVQPDAIAYKVQDGSYVVNNSNLFGPSYLPLTRDRRGSATHSHFVSSQLRSLLDSPLFLHSIPLSLSSTVSFSSQSSQGKADPYDGNQPLSLILLETMPDFIHVLSLKGNFLYVAPSVRRVLGYEPEELVGKCISDFCHPADEVPFMRELKESSTSSLTSPDGQSLPAGLAGPPRPVDLLFRLKSKHEGYVWVECRGRLHIEPGKGRKAVILSGRSRTMPCLSWDAVVRSGGVTTPVAAEEGLTTEREFWGLLSPAGVFLAASVGIGDILGWTSADIIGSALKNLVIDDENGATKRAVQEELARVCGGVSQVSQTLSLRMQTKHGSTTCVSATLYGSQSSSPIVTRIKVATAPAAISSASRDLRADVFEELHAERGSSWQYELQQVKFANQRLQDEIEALEMATSTHPEHYSPVNSPYSVVEQCRHTLGGPPLPWSESWPSMPSTPVAEYPSSQSGMKRSWEFANA